MYAEILEGDDPISIAEGHDFLAEQGELPRLLDHILG
jgi:hypothetical protein